MKIKLSNLRTLMECPICGSEALELMELELADHRNFVSFDCIACGYTISNKSPYENIEGRLATEPLNYFKKEIDRRRNETSREDAPKE